MTLQDIAINLAVFVSGSFDVILVALMFWINDCYHKNEEELSYWSTYAVHPLYFVLMAVVFATFFIYLAVRYNAAPFAYLGGSTLALVAMLGVYYAVKKCD